MRPWAVAAAVAERQHLVVAPWQLRVIGLSSGAARNRVAAHGWRRCPLGMLWLPGPDTPMRRLAAAVLAYSRPTGASGRVEQRLASGEDLHVAVARAALHAGQAVCGPSAAWLHGLAAPPSESWLHLPTRSGHLRRPGVRLRYETIAGFEHTWVQGLPVVDVERALLGVAAASGRNRRKAHTELAQLLAVADARRATTLAAVERRAAAAAQSHGSALLSAVLADLRDELPHSATERRARRIVNEVLQPFGLVLHRRPYKVHLDGRVVGEADLAVVELRYDIEIDGPHHLLPAQRQSDDRRDRLLRRAGWEVERYPVEVVDARPRELADAVRQTVAALVARESSR